MLLKGMLGWRRDEFSQRRSIIIKCNIIIKDFGFLYLKQVKGPTEIQKIFCSVTFSYDRDVLSFA